METNVVRMDRAYTCSFMFIVITCLRQFSARVLYPSCPLVRLLSFTKFLISIDNLSNLAKVNQW